MIKSMYYLCKEYHRVVPNPKCFYDLHVSVFEIIMYFKGSIKEFLSLSLSLSLYDPVGMIYSRTLLI